MNLVTGVIVYACLWWVIFFMMLPIGVQKDLKPQNGNDPGAPVKTNLKKKVLITSLAALILWGLYGYILTQTQWIEEL